MERPEHLKRVIEIIRSHSDKLTQELVRPRLPIFWISGPSGCGKSVLLLQVMRELILQGLFNSGNYLGEFAHLLPISLSYWYRSPERGLIVIDDAFAPENRDPKVWRTVAETVFRCEWQQLPLLLTCGPIEQFRDFRDEVKRHAEIQLEEVRIKPMEQDERIAYHRWYQERTSTPVPLSTEPIFIAAAWIYELRRRNNLSPDEFAQRFEDRLKALGLLEAAFTALALNQYGLKAPDRWFAGKEDPLDQLVSEQIYRLSNPTLGARHGRFFHPSVARVIYDARVAKDALARRACDLARGFAAMLDDSEAAGTFLAWLSAPKTQLNPSLKQATLSAMWKAFRVCNLDPQLMLLLKRWHELAHINQVDLDSIGARAAISRWFRSTFDNDPSRGLLFQMVWDDASLGERSGLLQTGLTWLETHEKDGAWSFVWRRLWAQYPLHEELCELGVLWLYDNPAHPGWSFLWQDLFEQGVEPVELLQAALAALPLQRDTTADLPLWQKVETLGPQKRRSCPQ